MFTIASFHSREPHIRGLVFLIPLLTGEAERRDCSTENGLDHLLAAFVPQISAVPRWCGSARRAGNACVIRRLFRCDRNERTCVCSNVPFPEPNSLVQTPR